MVAIGHRSRQWRAGGERHRRGGGGPALYAQPDVEAATRSSRPRWSSGGPMRIEGAISIWTGPPTPHVHLNEAPRARSGSLEESRRRTWPGTSGRWGGGKPEYMVDTFCLPLYARTGDGRGERPGDRGELPGQVPARRRGRTHCWSGWEPWGSPAASPPPARPFRHRTPWSVWGCEALPVRLQFPSSTGLRPDRTSSGCPSPGSAPEQCGLRMPSMPHAAPNGRAFWWRGCMTAEEDQEALRCLCDGIFPADPRISRHWSGLSRNGAGAARRQQESTVRMAVQTVPNTAKWGSRGRPAGAQPSGAGAARRRKEHSEGWPSGCPEQSVRIGSDDAAPRGHHLVSRNKTSMRRRVF